MAEGRHAPHGAGLASEMVEPARSGARAYLVGAFVTVVSLVVVAIFTQFLIEDPRTHAEAFANTVHSFNLIVDDGRSEFAAAADDQRDATEDLVERMMDGAPVDEIRLRDDQLRSKYERYQRAGARLRFIGDNYAPILEAPDRPPQIRALGEELQALRDYEQDLLVAAGHFKDCMGKTADTYIRGAASPSSDPNPQEVRCKSRRTVYLLFDSNRIAHAGEVSDELTRLDSCETGVELELNYIAATLSSEAESARGTGSFASRTFDTVSHWFADPPLPPAPVPPKLYDESLAERCFGTSGGGNHVLLPQPAADGSWPPPAFHPRAGTPALPATLPSNAAPSPP